MDCEVWSHLAPKKQQQKKQGKCDHEGFDSCKRPSNLTQIGFKSSNFYLYDLQIRWMTYLEKRIGHLLYATQSFMHHFKAIGEFKLELQPGDATFESKSAIFLYYVTWKFDGWPWKTIEQLYYAMSSFVHPFVAAISEFKLELQSGNYRFG